jgi:hypothetical protein
MCGRVLFALVALLLVLAVPAGASAHGRAAAVTRVIAADANGPWLLELTEGLARRSGGRWRFMCPAQFGLSALTFTASADGENAFVAGASELYRLTPNSTEVEGAPRLSGRFLLDLAASPDRPQVYGLLLQSNGSALLSLEPGRLDELWSSETEWHALVVLQSELLLARAGEKGITFQRAALGGELLATWDVELPHSVLGVTLHAAGATAFAVVAHDAGFSALEIAPPGSVEPLYTSPSNIDGIALRAEGERWLATGGELFRVSGERTVESMDPGKSVSCLAAASDRIYACSGGELLELTSGEGTVAFELKELEGPVVDGSLDPSACSVQWRVFESDLAAAGYRDSASERAGETPAVGCAITAPRRGGAFELVGIVVFFASVCRARVGLPRAPRSHGGFR